MDSQKVSRTRSRTPLPNEKYAFPPVFSPTSPPVSPALQIQLTEILEGQRKLSRHFDNLLALPHPQILGRSVSDPSGISRFSTARDAAGIEVDPLTRVMLNKILIQIEELIAANNQGMKPLETYIDNRRALDYRLDVDTTEKRLLNAKRKLATKEQLKQRLQKQSDALRTTLEMPYYSPVVIPSLAPRSGDLEGPAPPPAVARASPLKRVWKKLRRKDKI